MSVSLGRSGGRAIRCAGSVVTWLTSLTRIIRVRVGIAVVVAIGCRGDAAGPDAAGTLASEIRIGGGDGQVSPAGAELASPLVVRVTDRHGRAVPGATVTWTSPNAAQLVPEQRATNDSGLARASWTLGASVGRYDATASLGAQAVSFSATAVEPLSLGALRRLRLATFEGSGQFVHPDVVRVPRGWAPARRFLAITPYPGGDVTHELPSIYRSGAATDWVVPTGGTNPVVRPWKGYLSDPDVVFEPNRRELWMYFRHVGRANSVFLTVSPDGVQWSRPERVVTAPNHQLVSPAVVRVGDGDWHMWAVNAGSAGCQSQTTTVEHRTSTDGLHWSPPERVDVSGPNALPPWHIDVAWIPEVGEFWALYNEKPEYTCATPALRLATSTDGLTWVQHPTPVLRAGIIPEFNDIVYRSTLEYDARTDMVTLWYSGARSAGETWVWSGAVERRSRQDLLRMIDTPEPGRRGSARSALVLLDAP